jgi:hypothetical protein
MLRRITPQQFEELLTYSELEPFGEDRMDLRFAMLASSIVGAVGGTAVGGKPYTPSDFLRSMQFDQVGEEKPVAKVQSPEYIEGLLTVWIDGSNNRLAAIRGR